MDKYKKGTSFEIPFLVTGTIGYGAHSKKGSLF